MAKGTVGATAGIEIVESPRARKRRGRRKRRREQAQEARWAAMASPVTITYRDQEANHGHE